MRAKWRKIIWAILAVQLFLVHLMIFQNRYLGYFMDRIVWHFSLNRLAYINWNKLATYMWLGSGCVVMFLHYLHYLRFRRACIRQIAPVSEPWILESMQKAIEETELHKREQGHFLYYNNVIREPFVIGFWEPILLLPKQEYDRQVLPFIFLHECNHIRHIEQIPQRHVGVRRRLMVINHQLMVEHERDIVLVVHINRVLKRCDLQPVPIRIVRFVQRIVET